jgi:hypothetical protein
MRYFLLTDTAFFLIGNSFVNNEERYKIELKAKSSRNINFDIPANREVQHKAFLLVT